MSLEQDPFVGGIVIYVSSYGGNVNNALAMRDLIKSSNKLVCTAGVGKVMSAGVTLLAAGTKGYRFISPDTACMIHQASMGADGKNSEVLSSAEFLKNMNSLVFKNLSIDTGTPINKFRKLIKDNDNADLYLNVETCIKLGIADRIEIPRVVVESPRLVVITNKPLEKK
jgi:ATP-dependent Clp protease protease subunit